MTANAVPKRVSTLGVKPTAASTFVKGDKNRSIRSFQVIGFNGTFQVFSRRINGPAVCAVL
jgi:hypothetical protein